MLMESAFIGPLVGLLTGLVGAYVAFRTLKPNIKVLNSQEQKNLADAAQVAANALVQTIQAFGDERAEIMKTFTDERKQYQEERAGFEKRIFELENHREERTRRIEELEAQVEKLKHKEIKNLQTQVTEGRDKYERLKRVNEKLVEALHDAKIPLPDFNGDLTETMERWKRGKK
jgi:predicted RNase H-like nuclease (RuvC/YqgF family)